MDEEAEKAEVWLKGQKLAKQKFNRDAYELNKRAKELEEEERRLEEEENRGKEKNT